MDQFPDPFWQLLDAELGASLPGVIKQLLNSTGFNSLLALKFFSNEDITLLEKEASGKFKTGLCKEDAKEFEDMSYAHDSFKIPVGIQRVLLNLSKQIEEKGFAKLSEMLINSKKSAPVFKLQNKSEKNKSNGKNLPNKSSIKKPVKKHQEVILQLANNWIKNKFLSKEQQNKYLAKIVLVKEVGEDLIGCVKCAVCDDGVKVYTKKTSDNTIWIISNFTRHVQKHEKNKAGNSNSFRNWFTPSTSTSTSLSTSSDSPQQQNNNDEREHEHVVHEIDDNSLENNLELATMDNDENLDDDDEKGGEIVSGDEQNKLGVNDCDENLDEDENSGDPGGDNNSCDTQNNVEECDKKNSVEEDDEYCEVEVLDIEYEEQEEEPSDSEQNFSSSLLRFERAEKDWGDAIEKQ